MRPHPRTATNPGPGLTIATCVYAGMNPIRRALRSVGPSGSDATMANSAPRAAAASSLAPELLVWAQSTDAGVAALAYSLTPWFPSLAARAVKKGVELLSSSRSPELRVTTLVTLGLLGDPTAVPAIHEQWRSAGDPVARTAAAIALGLISGSSLPDDALATLLDAERWRAELDDASRRLPFARTLNGYVAKAIGCVEA